MRYVYGPVLSRRLGLSLGVDLVPRKVCTYDCIYCQIGRTTLKTLERKEYVPASSILREVEEALRSCSTPPDYVTLSGSGEPTLNERLGEILKGIKGMSPSPLAVITNGSLLYRGEVAEVLLEADVVLPSLDAVTPAVFETINRPHPDLRLEEIVKGLKAFRQAFKGKLWLEVLLCRGVNDGRAELQALKEVIAEIGPDAVHLNTVVRPGVEEYAYPLPYERLSTIAKELGEGVEVITRPPQRAAPSHRENLEEQVLRTLKVRPLTLEDLSRSLGLHEMEALKVLDQLADEGKITSRIFDHRIYYEAKGPKP